MKSIVRLLDSRPQLILLAALALASGAQASDVDPRVTQAIEKADAAIQTIVDVPQGQRTFGNTLGAIDDLQAQFMLDTQLIQFLGYVSPDAELRKVAQASEVVVDAWFIDFGKRVDLYEAVKAFADSKPALEGAEARLLEETMRDYKRSGMELSAEDREKLTEIEKEMSKLGIEFQKTIREDDTTILLGEEELKGVPKDVLDGLERSGDLLVCGMAYTTYNPIMTYCEVESTRQKMAFAYRRRGGLKNIATLEKLIALRDQQARLLGYESTAAFVTETRMAKTPETVAAFYEELRPKLRVKSILDFEEYTRAKREHTGNPEAVMTSWDRSFYDNYLMKTKYAVDGEKVRQYFSLEAALDGLFQITQSLYGLEYKEVTAQSEAKGRKVWHPDVTLYEVWDKNSKELLGEFYLDLHPRDNKYNHAAKFGIEPRKMWSDGTVHKPVCALVCNFTKPTADKPSLMTHDEVETLFHEFGHCLHSILTEADLSSFEGTRVARDFVEAPSQMFENWVWDADVLSMFAKHYETGETLPGEVLEGMLAARYLGSGIKAEGQVYLGLMDYRFHTAAGGEVDTSQVANATYDECFLYDRLEGTYFHAAFGHMVGYHAGYYGYLWSLVYAADMFSRFKAEGLLNPKVGMEYRKKVLAPGGTRDAMDLVRDFLGREPRADAFLEHLGLTQGQ